MSRFRNFSVCYHNSHDECWCLEVVKSFMTSIDPHSPTVSGSWGGGERSALGAP